MVEGGVNIKKINYIKIKLLIYNLKQKKFMKKMNSLYDIGEGTIIVPSVKIKSPSNIIIGKHCRIGKNAHLFTELADGKLLIGENVQINKNVLLDYSGELVIGSNTLISDEVIIYSHSHGYNPRSVPVPLTTTLDNNVWIGARSIIMPGIRIGEYAVVGAGSVVTKNVPPFTVVGGNPAKILKKTVSM